MVRKSDVIIKDTIGSSCSFDDPFNWNKLLEV